MQMQMQMQMQARHSRSMFDKALDFAFDLDLLGWQSPGTCISDLMLLLVALILTNHFISNLSRHAQRHQAASIGS